MDEIDMMLLRLLESNGPIHTTELAWLLGVAEGEVLQRMGRLQDLVLVEHLSPEANA